jgi:hypothetical protein
MKTIMTLALLRPHRPQRNRSKSRRAGTSPASGSAGRTCASSQAPMAATASISSSSALGLTTITRYVAASCFIMARRAQCLATPSACRRTSVSGDDPTLSHAHSRGHRLCICVCRAHERDPAGGGARYTSPPCRGRFMIASAIIPIEPLPEAKTRAGDILCAKPLKEAEDSKLPNHLAIRAHSSLLHAKQCGHAEHSDDHARTHHNRNRASGADTGASKRAHPHGLSLWTWRLRAMRGWYGALEAATMRIAPNQYHTGAVAGDVFHRRDAPEAGATMINRYLTIVVATIIFALAFVALMTSIRSAEAHRMTGGDIRRSGVHHCTWSAASACKRPSQRRQVPCGNGRYCRW